MRFVKWTVEIQVEESWVADGFDLTKERAHDMVADTLPGAMNTEIKVKIIEKPRKAVIKQLQEG